VRKKNPRKPRPVAKLLSPAQHDRLIVGPRLHLTLLCSGQGTREHAVTVAATFNIGIALAHLSKNTTFQNLFENAQKRLLGALTPSDTIRLPEDVGTDLKVAFNKLDRYIGIQNDRALFRAIEFINRAVSTGEGADVVDLPD